MLMDMMRPTFVTLLATAIASNALTAQITAPRLTLTRESKIDAADNDLIPFTTMLVSRTKQVFIPQNKDGKFILLDSTGKQIKAIGRPGSGPGEFAAGPALGLFMGWVADSIWIYESQARRATWLAPDGTFLRNWAALLEQPDPRLYSAGKLGFTPSAFYADGSILTIDRESAAPDAAAMYVVVSRTGTLLRQIMKFPVPPRKSAVGIKTSDTTSITVITPFANPSVSGLARDGLRVGLATEGNKEFRITVIKSSGDTVFSRAYPYTPIPIAQQTVDSIVGASRTRIPPSYQAEAAAVIRKNLPDNYPPVASNGVQFGLDATTWVIMNSVGATSTVLALDAKGVPFGQFELPRTSRFGAADRTHVWIIEQDDDGLTSVVRYRISGSKS